MTFGFHNVGLTNNLRTNFGRQLGATNPNNNRVQNEEVTTQQQNMQRYDVTRTSSFTTLSANAVHSVLNGKTTSTNNTDNNKDNKTTTPKTKATQTNQASTQQANNERTTQTQRSYNVLFNSYHYQVTNPLQKTDVASVAKGLYIKETERDKDTNTVTSSGNSLGCIDDFDEEAYNQQYRIIREITDEKIGCDNKIYQVESKKPIMIKCNSVLGGSFAVNAYAAQKDYAA